ncbi:hypothetical protein GCM10009077_20160 [Roseibium denhamense]|uniref:PilZ domain-containing protein n=2 Tax=Roseibium denhamense TaxID=76305 RepID=A0ABY1P372_9HYPH|nr:PilZ domain-containing protein [Roseibium denhamense]
MQPGAAAMSDNAKVSVLVVDLADMSCFEAHAHSFTKEGCWIVSDRIDSLKQEIGLRLQGFDRLLPATVVAYGDNEVKVTFTAKRSEQGEKRREIRRPVWISAMVSSPENPYVYKLQIIDASRSGCRLEGEKVEWLPEKIEISIPGLDLPINGRVVWRGGKNAGVRLDWPFEPDTKPIDFTLDPEPEPADERPKPKRRISAFGS